MGIDRGKSTFKVPADKAERRLAVTYCPISKLKLNPKNPRRHKRAAISKLACSIQALSMNVPVIIDATGMLLLANVCAVVLTVESSCAA